MTKHDADAIALKERFPKINRIIIGRGLLANPALAGRIKECEKGLPMKHGSIWVLIIRSTKKALDTIRKCKTSDEYHWAVREILF